MKIEDLERINKPVARPVKSCVACKAFAAECIVPIGEASAAMCWICAHHIIEHECRITEAGSAKCKCPPHKIYPDRAVNDRRSRSKTRHAA